MDAREAVMSNNLSKLKELHSAGVNIDFKDEDERTPLHWAACLGSVSIVEFLLNVAKVRMNVQDDAGWTPLMSATSAGHIEIVSMLLCHGADANLANYNNQLPLHFHKGRQEIVELLIDYTKDINHIDHIGNTPLMRAMGGNPSRGMAVPEVIACLIDHGARLNIGDRTGNCVLHLALLEGHEDIARFLVEHGADPMAKNNDKKSCLDFARNALRSELQVLHENTKP